MQTHQLFFPLLALSALWFGACGGAEDPGVGQLDVTAYGEAFIEEGIPADAMNDGWSVTFDHFIVTVDEVVVGGVVMHPASPIDLTAASGGEGHVLVSEEMEAADYTASSYRISHVDLAGTATHDGVTKAFAWVFDTAIDYTGCHTTTTVTDGGTGTFQITVHADHFFYDSIVSEEPDVRFQALADADLDDDGTITQAELEATDIGAYDPGSEGGIDNLWLWLQALSQTLGHVDGEGHCDASPHAE